MINILNLIFFCNPKNKRQQYAKQRKQQEAEGRNIQSSQIADVIFFVAIQKITGIHIHCIG